MKKNRIALFKMFTSFRNLDCQGLAVRGKSDKDSNLTGLLYERKDNVPELAAQLNREETYKWLSHDVTNEILFEFSKAVLKQLGWKAKEAEWFGDIIEETADIANNVQVSFCFHIVDDNWH